MKIVTINVPESYLGSIEKLVGEHGLYPSRSELIRVAVREFLIKELQMANNMAKFKEVKIEADDFDEEKFVRVPIERLDEEDEPVREFKTYKIVSNLDYYEPSKKKERLKPQGRKKKKREPLGNIYWENKLDENGNLIRIPKN